MKKQINELLLKMQIGDNCIGETSNKLLELFSQNTNENKVDRITIHHPDYGEITIHSEIKDEVQQSIGDVVNDFSHKALYYHATIKKEKNGVFEINDLRVIKADGVNVGFMQNSKGYKNFITVIKNIYLKDNITVYPSSILSINYNKQTDEN